MRRYEHRKVERMEKVLIGVCCSECKKKLNEGDLFFDVTTHHNHWGSESIESIERHELCSMKCLQIHLKIHFEHEGFVDGMSYEIETDTL